MSSRACLPATSSLVTAVSAIRRVERRTSSLARMASVRSLCNFSFRLMATSSRSQMPHWYSCLDYVSFISTGVVAGAAGLDLLGVGGHRAIELRRVTVPVLDPEAAPLRVLHVTDLHLTPAQQGKAAWVRRLATLQPDLVVNTGDNLAHPDAVDSALFALDPLLDVPGVFVMGSNDYYGPVWKNPAQIPSSRLRWTGVR